MATFELKINIKKGYRYTAYSAILRLATVQGIDEWVLSNTTANEVTLKYAVIFLPFLSLKGL
jgi:hypothetical protein